MTIKIMQTYSYEMYKLLNDIRSCLWQDAEAFARIENAMNLFDCIDELFKEMRNEVS